MLLQKVLIEDCNELFTINYKTTDTTVYTAYMYIFFKVGVPFLSLFRYVFVLPYHNRKIPIINVFVSR